MVAERVGLESSSTVKSSTKVYVWNLSATGCSHFHFHVPAYVRAFEAGTSVEGAGVESAEAWA